MEEYVLMMEWENGELPFKEEVKLFKSLAKKNSFAFLQGCYGRHYQYLKDSGFL